MLEPFRWYYELADRGNGVPGDLRALAILAFSGPTGDVLSDRRPYKFGADGLSSSLDSGVTQAVDSVEYASSPGVWHEGSCGTIRDVNDDLGVADVNFFEVESSASFCRDASVLRIEGLFPRHFAEVDAHIGDGVDDCGEVVGFRGRDRRFFAA